jgi:hypothetical protein
VALASVSAPAWAAATPTPKTTSTPSSKLTATPTPVLTPTADYAPKDATNTKFTPGSTVAFSADCTLGKSSDVATVIAMDTISLLFTIRKSDGSIVITPFLTVMVDGKGSVTP